MSKYIGKVVRIAVRTGSNTRHFDDFRQVQDFYGEQYSSVTKLAKLARDMRATRLDIDYQTKKGVSVYKEVYLNDELHFKGYTLIKEKFTKQEIRHFIEQSKGNERIIEVLKKEFEYILAKDIKVIKNLFMNKDIE